MYLIISYIMHNCQYCAGHEILWRCECVLICSDGANVYSYITKNEASVR